MEAQPYALTMQDEMIGELEKTAPQYVVRVSGHASWLEHPQSPALVFDWWHAYGPQHYRLGGCRRHHFRGTHRIPLGRCRGGLSAAVFVLLAGTSAARPVTPASNANLR